MFDVKSPFGDFMFRLGKLQMCQEDFVSLEDFADYAAAAVYDNQNYEIDLQFYLTRRCNLSCDGCYMSASPGASGDRLPGRDIAFYLNEFQKEPQFTHNVVFSGGEIFTAPISYLEYNINRVLAHDCALQLKTNGSWIQDENTREAVLGMLRRLKPGRGLMAGTQQVEAFFANKPRWLLRLLGRDVVRRWLYWKLPTVSLLSMAVSVDDKLHPKKSAQWFLDIVNSFAEDKRLKQNIDLKTFTVSGSKAFLGKNVLFRPGCVLEYKQADTNLLKYTLNGVPVESYFGDFVDVNQITHREKLENFVLPPLGDARGRLVYCFYPDKTVGLDSCYLQSVGRVPYTGRDGAPKSFDAIRQDILVQLVLDYQCAISK